MSLPTIDCLNMYTISRDMKTNHDDVHDEDDDDEDKNYVYVLFSHTPQKHMFSFFFLNTE